MPDAVIKHHSQKQFIERMMFYFMDPGGEALMVVEAGQETAGAEGREGTSSTTNTKQREQIGKEVRL